MTMFKKSVSSLLLTLMALLAAGALASTAIQMVGAFGRYTDSIETARLAAADKAIFHGVLSLRNNRGDAQSALLGDDDARPKLQAAEKAEQGAMTASPLRSPRSNSLGATNLRARSSNAGATLHRSSSCSTTRPSVRAPSARSSGPTPGTMPSPR